jgi:hypothetical protein
MYVVDGRRYRADERGLETALLSARLNGTRPLCLCNGTGVPVYVSRQGGRPVAKRMPLSGQLHSPDCPHHGEADVTHKLPAIRRDPQTGLVRVRLNVPLSARDPSSPDAMSASPMCQLRRSDQGRDSLDLRELLLLLWHEADLMRWLPAFEGKRSWRVVRGHVLHASQHIVVSGRRLHDILFLPEVFSITRRDEIDVRRRQRFDATFEPGSRRRLLLVAEVRRLILGTTACAVVFKHLPDLHVSFDSRRHRELLRALERGVVAPRPHPVAIAALSAPQPGELAIESVAVVEMDERWLPIGSP